jgi:hypothetical protein
MADQKQSQGALVPEEGDKPQPPPQNNSGPTANIWGQVDAENFVVGTQFNYGTQEELKVLLNQFKDLQEFIDTQSLSLADRKMADKDLATLKKELTTEKPDGEVIKTVGERLLATVPTVLGLLASLFASPVVVQVVTAAGNVAVEWAKARFGTGGTS